MEVKSPLVVGWSQDHHCFHRRLKVNRITETLLGMFPDDVTMEDMDTLFFGGDFFDHLASDPTADEVQDALIYMGRQLSIAAKRNVRVRVLKGTPSHDREQNVYWETVNSLLDKPADLIYVDKLWIESHPTMGDVLYIPDCWKPTADEVWEDVCEAMRLKNITKVDWIIMHGAFKHQLPPHLHDKLDSLHDSDRYADITRKYVLVGHVHLRSQYRNIISSGSLDRLAFGEEGPKGGLSIRCHDHGDDIIFLENDNARAMITLDVTELDLNETIDLIDKNVKENDRFYMSIRLIASKLSEVYVNLNTIENMFEPVEFVFKDINSKQKNHLIYLEVDKTPTKTVNLSNENSMLLLKAKIGEDYNDRIHDIVKDIFGVKNEQTPE